MTGMGYEEQVTHRRPSNHFFRGPERSAFWRASAGVSTGKGEGMIHVQVYNSARGIGAARKAFLALFAALLAVLALAPQANAQAVINEPPQLPHEVVVFPQRDFVVAEGYQDGQRLDFEVIRKDTGGNDVTVGTASGVVAGGLLEVNHPGGVCWTDQTPDILPGDRVVVTDPSGNGDAVTTANVKPRRPS